MIRFREKEATGLCNKKFEEHAMSAGIIKEQMNKDNRLLSILENIKIIHGLQNMFLAISFKSCAPSFIQNQ